VLIEACGALTPEQAGASLPTGAGTPAATIKHLIGAESYYLSLIRGSFLDWDWDEERPYTTDQLLEYAGELSRAWEALLPGLDPERMLDTRRSRLKAGVLLTQALHHANVHREQISAVLTSLGLTPPDISGWAYGRASGGIVLK
jgi:uncharacterized damage-inducible protein DinB